MMEGAPGADSEEKHEPVRNIDTVVVDSLKALDLKRPIREADIVARSIIRFPLPGTPTCLIQGHLCICMICSIGIML